jgi:hypothetical protein
MRPFEAVVEEVRSLPVQDRLRLVERIVHEIAETSPVATPPARPKVSPVGWLADEPELADQFEQLMAEVRARGRVRGPGDDEDAP